MVKTLIRMRLNLLKNSFQGLQALSSIMGIIGGLGIGAGVILLTVANQQNKDASIGFLSVVFAVWCLGWIIGPIFMGGSSTELKPEYFLSMPVNPLRLGYGLLLASLVGIGPLVTCIVLAASIVFAVHLGILSTVVAFVGLPLQLLVIMLISKVFVEWIGNSVTSTVRAIVSALPWAVLGALVSQSWMLLPEFAKIYGIGKNISSLVQILPTGWSIAAIASADHFELFQVLFYLAGLIIFALGLLYLWSHLFVERTTRASSIRLGKKHVHTELKDHVSKLWLKNRVGAVITRELHTALRDFNRLIYLAFAVFFSLAFCLIPLLVGNRIYLAGMGLLIAIISTSGSAQLYANDGTALWINLMNPGSEKYDVRGRQLAWLILVAPAAAICTVVGAILSGADWVWPWVLSLLPAFLGGGAGIIVLVSVFFLVPVADPLKRHRNSISSDSSGLISWAMLPLSLLSALPAAIFPLLGMILQNNSIQWIGIPIGVITGISSMWLFGRIAYKQLSANGPELLLQMRSGTKKRTDTLKTPDASDELLNDMPKSKAVEIWLLYSLSFVLLIIQLPVSIMMDFLGNQSKTWFLVLYLPGYLRLWGFLILLATGMISGFYGYKISKRYSKSARKRFYIP